MIKKWHVNDQGNAGKCSASVRDCPLGASESEHYSTKAEEIYAYETSQESNTFNNVLKKPMKKSGSLKKQKMYKFMALGGVAITSFSLAACDSNISINDDGDVEVSVEGENYKIDTENGDVSDEGGNDNDESPSVSPSSISPDDVLWMGQELSPSADEVEQAKDNLSNLAVADEIERPDYDRDEMFGSFNTGTVERTEHRDLPFADFEDSDSRATGGYMIDPYTGDEVDIEKGKQNDIDTEHVVPLKEVTESERIIINTDSEAEAIKADTQLLTDYVNMGESNLTESEISSIENDPDLLDNYYLDEDEKDEIANSEDNVTIVSSAANRSKSDEDPGEWLPSYEPTQCKYVISTITVKTEYHLSVDPQEASALKDVLDNKCDS